MQIERFGVIKSGSGRMSFYVVRNHCVYRLTSNGKFIYSDKLYKFVNTCLKFKRRNTLGIKNELLFDYCIIDNRFMIKLGLDNNQNVGLIRLGYVDELGKFKITTIQQDLAYKIKHKWSRVSIYDL